MKFFPIYEGGALVSARHSLAGVALRSAGRRGFEAKAALAALESSFAYGRLPLVHAVLRLPLWLKDRAWGAFKRSRSGAAPVALAPSSSDSGVEFEPRWIGQALVDVLARRDGAGLDAAASPRCGASITCCWKRPRAACPACARCSRTCPTASCPWQFPLLADDPEPLFARAARGRRAGGALRRAPCGRASMRKPVPTAQRLSRQVLALPCHQELRDDELAWMAGAAAQGAAHELDPGTRPRSFATTPAQWSALHARRPGLAAAGGRLRRSRCWREFGAGAELLACCARRRRRDGAGDAARPDALADLPAGAGADRPVAAGRRRRPAPRCAASLARALPGFALVLGVTQCDPELAAAPAGRRPCRRRSTTSRPRASRWRAAFDDYWQGRGKNLRGNLKKQRARLEREGVALRLEVSALARCGGRRRGRLRPAGKRRLEGRRRHRGRMPTTPRAASTAACSKAFCARGAGSIYRYWFGDQLVATDLCVEGGGCIVVLKTTYDESVPATLSPTLLMREEACRQLFDEGRFARIEFYGKVMEWHLRWTDEVRTLYHLNTYRWPALRTPARASCRRAPRQHINRSKQCI